MNNAKAKIVITGGSGFLGINLAHVLLESNYEVCLISRYSLKWTGKTGQWNKVVLNH